MDVRLSRKPATSAGVKRFPGPNSKSNQRQKTGIQNILHCGQVAQALRSHLPALPSTLLRPTTHPRNNASHASRSQAFCAIDPSSISSVARQAHPRVGPSWRLQSELWASEIKRGNPAREFAPILAVPARADREKARALQQYPFQPRIDPRDLVALTVVFSDQSGCYSSQNELRRLRY
jgi:hypothetical protein